MGAFTFLFDLGRLRTLSKNCQFSIKILWLLDSLNIFQILKFCQNSETLETLTSKPGPGVETSLPDPWFLAKYYLCPEVFRHTQKKLWRKNIEIHAVLPLWHVSFSVYNITYFAQRRIPFAKKMLSKDRLELHR